MRAVLFSTALASLLTFGMANAQVLSAPYVPAPNLSYPVSYETPAPRSEQIAAAPLFLERVLVEDSLRDRLSDRRLDFGVPIASTQFRFRTESYYLKDGMKQRTEGLYAVRKIDENALVYAGAWTTKYSQAFLPRNEKEWSIGFGGNLKFSYKPKYRF